uniref:Uncharacterized protein n=1 Tax=Odontella aurita TaxID=265563 RepID=A0A7S4MNX0_9STRA|mmetsp:Transcript_27189/g.80216  ORF Transcript_27189/g.80216 Transcript_27189/m.80216 type:complete len:317 (+) Transcript_27189:7-957(+)
MWCAEYRRTLMLTGARHNRSPRLLASVNSNGRSRGTSGALSPSLKSKSTFWGKAQISFSSLKEKEMLEKINARRWHKNPAEGGTSKANAGSAHSRIILERISAVDLEEETQQKQKGGRWQRVARQKESCGRASAWASSSAHARIKPEERLNVVASTDEFATINSPRPQSKRDGVDRKKSREGCKGVAKRQQGYHCCYGAAAGASSAHARLRLERGPATLTAEANDNTGGKGDIFPDSLGRQDGTRTDALAAASSRRQDGSGRNSGGMQVFKKRLGRAITQSLLHQRKRGNGPMNVTKVAEHCSYIDCQVLEPDFTS